MSTSQLSVLLVDDHYIVRAGIRDLLQQAADVRVEGEAGSGAEAMAHISARDWNLVMLDFNLPDISGLELLKIIKKAKPSMPVLMFSSFSENEFALACCRAGAGGYVTKDADKEVIQKAVRHVAAGKLWLSEAMQEKLLNGGNEKSCEPHETLTCREYDVLLGISRGYSLTEIGEQLNLSVKTISTHRGKVLVKLDVTTNAELTKYVMSKMLDTEGANR